MIIKYCIECAGLLTKKSDSEYTCHNGHTFWNNPQATAAVVLIRSDKLLVSKRGREPFKGLYDLPGGFIEYGEDPYQAAIREINEETGIQLQRTDLELLTAYTGFYFENESLCDLIMVAKQWSGEPVAADDSAALEWRNFDFIDAEEFAPEYFDLAALLSKLSLR